MEQVYETEKDAFYILRKGDLIGVYKSLADCQAQAASSGSDTKISIFKGYGLPKEVNEFLASHGLKNAAYVINAVDVQTNHFGEIITCPFQEPPSRGKALHKGHTQTEPPSRGKAIHKDYTPTAMIGGQTFSTFPVKSESSATAKVTFSSCESCVLEFDGASRGNPGPAGSGAVLRAEDGSVIYRLREGVGIATNNVAEYRALILGLNYALGKGFKHIRAQGDSNLVCMQVQGLWKIKNQNLAVLCAEAKELMNKFSSFQIKHVYREFNSEADAQANLAINLKNGQVDTDCNRS